MIHAIAIKLRNDVIDTLQFTRTYFDTDCEETLGRGVKFNIEGNWVYSDTDYNLNCDTFTKFKAWDYMNGGTYRQHFNISDFWPLCIYKGYIYGLQDCDRELYYNKTDTSKMRFGSQGIFELSHDQFLAVLSLDKIACFDSSLLATFKAYIIGVDAPSKSNKGENTMNFSISDSLFKNLRCGKAGADFGISLLDGSITYKGRSYDGKSLVETAGFEINAGDFLFIMPCTEIKKGDIVALNNGAAYYDGKSFISLATGMKTEFVPTTCFGMTFYSVVRNMLGNFTGSTNNIANLLPLLLLDKSGDSDDLMKLMLLMNGGLNFNFGAAAPAKTSK